VREHQYRIICNTAYDGWDQTLAVEDRIEIQVFFSA
jgi:hypothetical protein